MAHPLFGTVVEKRAVRGKQGQFGAAPDPKGLVREMRQTKPGNTGGGKSPDFWRAFEGAEDR